MPSPPLANTLEGGSDTTTITNGNSGGASGDAFDTITAACTFSGTHVMHGALAMKVAEPGVFAKTIVTWKTLGSLTVPVYFRWYWWQPSIQTVGVMSILRALTAVPGRCASIDQSATTGILRGFNAANSAIAATAGTIAPNVAGWCRLEARIVASTTVGEIEWRLYNTPEAPVGSWTDRGTATGQVLGANIDQVDFGLDNAGPISVDYFYDTLGVSTVDWIGPLVAAAPVYPVRRSPLGL